MTSIEKIDCMVQAVISVTKKPEAVEQLRQLRMQQLESSPAHLDPQVELQNLLVLFAAIGETVSVTLATVYQLEELNNLLSEGKTILVGFPKGESFRVPHIVHVAETYEQPGQVLRKGYKSDQEYLDEEKVVDSLMEQGQLQLFVIE